MVPATLKVKMIEEGSDAAVVASCRGNRFSLSSMPKISSDDEGCVPYWFMTPVDDKWNMEEKSCMIGNVKVACLVNPKKLSKGTVLSVKKVKATKEVKVPQPIDLQSMMRTRKRKKTTQESHDVE